MSENQLSSLLIDSNTSPRSPVDVLMQWRERLLNYILRGAAIVGVFVLAASVLGDIQIHDWVNIAVTATAYAVLLVVNFIRLPYRVRAGILVFLLFAMSMNSLLSSGVRGEARMFVIIFVLLTLMLLGIRAGLAALAISAVSITVLAWAVMTQRFTLNEPYDQLNLSSWLTGSLMMLLVIVLLVLGVVLLQREFQAAQKREKLAMDGLVQERGQLESRVSERTRELSLAADVGRSVSQLHDLDVLLPKAVELIRSQYNLYYAQIFLADATGRTLTLRAGTGGVGAELLRRGHRLPVGPGSITGVAAAERKTMIVADTATNPVYRPNPLLPETRSELALPLLVGERVVGVLDLQSRHPGALSAENLSVFETLAGQLAIALDNAALFAQTEQSRQEVEERTRHMAQTGWQEYLNALERSERIGYVYDQTNLKHFNTPLPQTRSENTEKFSILVTGAPVGTVQLERGSDQPWQDEELGMITAVIDQASRQLENLRLLAQSDSYRIDAEEAARRLTREGWAEYLQTKKERQGYVYDQTEVKPLDEVKEAGVTGVVDTGQTEKKVVQPLKVGVEMVGELAFDGIDALDTASSALVNNVAGLLSDHIEELRLTEQTQKALIETEQLYTASAELNTAHTYEEILGVLRSHTMAGEGAQAVTINLFNRPWVEEDMPERVETVAAWNELGLEGFLAHTSMASIPSAPVILHADAPSMFEDVKSDTRMNGNARAILLKLDTSRSAIFVPLVAGGQWVGFVMAAYRQPRKFPAEDVRRLVALAGQAAVAVNNLRLLDQTQALAQREKNLRQITSMVRGSTNADTILRTATRELGTVLGRKVKVQLSGTPKTGATPEDLETGGDAQRTNEA
jgi:GAF domain-containing protein